MNILVLNSGSSSLKVQLINSNSGEALHKGHVDGIGLATCKVIFDGKETIVNVKNHDAAIKNILKEIDLKKIDAIGHRVVHGGEKYSKATLVNSAVINEVKKLSKLAPLHNPPNLAGILACKKLLPKVKQVAVFDTAFHQTMPEHAYMYAIPKEYYKKYKIRKYGFHGTSHKYVMLEAQKILKKKSVNLITCHLGNGASICAIKNSKSIDTSMGFTPLQGLMMGTRSGDLDPEIVEFLSQNEKLTVSEVINILNKKSGLLGIDGDSDLRAVHDRVVKGDKKAKLGFDMFTYRILEYIGSYLTVVGNVDAIVFTAGIGQGAWYLREKLAKSLVHLGIKIDTSKNKKHELVISEQGSKIKLLVIPTNEELMIAKEAKAVL